MHSKRTNTRLQMWPCDPRWSLFFATSPPVAAAIGFFDLRVSRPSATSFALFLIMFAIRCTSYSQRSAIAQSLSAVALIVVLLWALCKTKIVSSETSIVGLWAWSCVGLASERTRGRSPGRRGRAYSRVRHPHPAHAIAALVQRRLPTPSCTLSAGAAVAGN